jgi:hypothetical protein
VLARRVWPLSLLSPVLLLLQPTRFTLLLLRETKNRRLWCPGTVPSFPPPKYDVSRAGTAWLPCQQPVPPGHVGYWGSVHLYKHVILLRAAAMAQGRGLKRGDAIDSWMGLMGSVEMEFGRRKKEMRNTLRFSCLEPLVPSGLFLTVFLCNPPSL